MPVVFKHGKTFTHPAICSKCQCMFEYTPEEIDSNGDVKCPDCKTLFNPDNKFILEDFDYTRNMNAEEAAITECLSSIDFIELSRQRAAIADAFKDDKENYDFLQVNNKPEKLKELAEKELRRCFDNMEEHGYYIHYRDGEIVMSYEIEGVYTTKVFYHSEKNEYWCTCDYSIASGASF